MVPSNTLERRFPLADSDFETQESPRPAILSYVDGIHFDLFKDPCVEGGVPSLH